MNNSLKAKEYSVFYESPLGKILLASDDRTLTGLWFCGQKYYPEQPEENLINITNMKEPEILTKAKEWLDRYFNGDRPDLGEIPLNPKGGEFRQAVWRILCQIPYGETVTYGEIAAKIAEQRGMKSISAQAVGGAVGHNPIGIIIPCHRVLGKNGTLTGYAGGLDRKEKLLILEGVL